MSDPAFTDDRLLDGRVALRQSADGYRAAIDPVLLAAAIPLSIRHALELGCGAGAASLCALARLPDLRILGLERDAGTAELARTNAAANDMAQRFEVEIGDVRSFAKTGFDLVFANPPYLPPQRAQASPHAARATANVEGDATLGHWIAAALRAVAPRGHVLFVQRADRLDDLIAGLHGHAGEIVVFPLWPKTGVPAKRILVRARKGIATPLRLAAGLVLHEADGSYTAAADAVLRGRSALALDAPERV
ncbi:MAG: methyltransferase [Magnetospirillum sp.]|nr:methyltransferase [Magnetospirillum sp.]